jgi:hypothetical protein
MELTLTMMLDRILYVADNSDIPWKLLNLFYRHSYKKVKLLSPPTAQEISPYSKHN